MKNVKVSKIITKNVHQQPKNHTILLCQKMIIKRKTQFIRAKGVKKLVSKGVKFSNYEKCVFDSIKNQRTTK